MNRFQRRRQAAIARSATRTDLDGGDWTPVAVPPEKVQCATCQVEGHGNVLGSFYRMPDGWLHMVMTRDDPLRRQGIVVTVCSEACADKWMDEHLVNEGDSASEPS